MDNLKFLWILCERCANEALYGSVLALLVLSGTASGRSLVGYRMNCLCLGSPVCQTIVPLEGLVHSFHVCISGLLLDSSPPLNDHRQEVLSCFEI